MKFYSDITKTLYDTADACEAAETAYLKAEEEKKNSHKILLEEIDALFAQFQEQQKVQEEAYKDVISTGKILHKKYAEYQRKYGRLPDKHYANYILTRML